MACRLHDIACADGVHGTDDAGAAVQEHAEEHLNAVNGLVSFADARLADMQALYVVVEERLQGMAAAQECAPG